MSRKKTPAKAFDLSGGTPDTIEDRQRREAAQLGVLDARLIRRTGRTIPVMMKTTPVKKKQHQDLMLILGATLVETYEAALDALQEKLEKENG